MVTRRVINACNARNFETYGVFGSRTCRSRRQNYNYDNMRKIIYYAAAHHARVRGTNRMRTGYRISRQNILSHIWLQQ